MKRGGSSPFFLKLSRIMKKYINTLFILSFVISLFSLKVSGQQVNEDTHIINQYFQSNKEAALLLQKAVDPSVFQSQNNGFSLNQVGYNNQINIRSGINNTQMVGQIGNYNNYQFIAYYNKNVSNFNIIQQGNSNSLQIYGENSLVKELSIVQKASFKTLIITNN